MLNTRIWRAFIRKLFREPGKHTTPRLRLEMLEGRVVPTTVTWVNSGSGNWDVGSNWSTGAVPKSTDTAVINTTGNATITIKSGDNITIQGLSTNSTDTLAMTGGTLSVTTGSSTLSGPLTMSGATLQANGSGASLTVNGTTSVSQSNLYALAGGTLSLPNLTSYTTNGTFQAANSGSVLSLPALTTVTVGSGGWGLNAVSGGTVNVSALTSLTSLNNSFGITDTGSSTIVAPKLTSLYGVTATFDGTDSPQIAQTWTSFTNAHLNINGGSYTLPNLTDVDEASLLVSNGAALSLPNLTSYTSNGTFQASNSGSVLSLPALTTATVGSGGWSMNAVTGGTVNVSALTSLTSLNDSFNINDTGHSTFVAPNLTSLYGVNATFDGTDSPQIAQPWTSFTNAHLNINGGSYTLPNLTNITEASLLVSNGATLSLPNVTSYLTNGTFQASNSGSVLSLPALTTVTVGSGGWSMNAVTGGTVNVSALTSLDSGNDSFNITDTGTSTFVAPNLTSLYGVNATFDGTDSPQIAQTWTSYTNATLNINGGSYTLPNLTDIDEASVFVRNGATLSLPNVTSYLTNGTFEAVNSKSVLNLSALTTVTLGNGGWSLVAASGGTVNVPGLTSLTSNNNSYNISDTGTSTIQDPNLTSLNGVRVTLDGTDPNVSNSWTTFLNGSLSISGGTNNFPNLTNADITLASGVTLNLPGLTAGAITMSNGTQANIQGSLVSFPATGTSNATVTLPASQGLTFILKNTGTLTGTTFNVGQGSVADIYAGTYLGTTTFNVGTSGSVDLTDGQTTTYGGTLTGSGGGTVQFTSGTLSPATGGVVISFPVSMFQWTGGSMNLAAGNVTNNGVINLSGSSQTKIYDDGTLFDYGTIVQTGTGNFGLQSENSTPTTLLIEAGGQYLLESNCGINNVSSTNAIVNAGIIRKLGGTGTSTIQITGNLNNTGIIEADVGMLVLTPTTITQVSGSSLTAGTWNAFGGATLKFPTGTSITTSAGSLALSGSGASIVGISGLASNNGNFSIGTGASVSAPGNFTNTGVLTLGGTLTLPGNFTQSATGTLNEQLGGSPSSGLFGQINAGGTATLSGTLNVSEVNGFVPQVGQNFAIITYTSETGNFTTISGLASPVTDSLTATAFIIEDSASGSSVSVSSSSIASGSAVTVVLQAADANGNPLSTGGLSVVFSLVNASGGQGTFSAVTDNGNGTYTATFTGTLAGTNAITATTNGQPIATTPPSITVTPGPVSLANSVVILTSGTVQSGSTDTITLQTVDTVGNDETTGGLAVAFALGSSSGGQGTFSSVTDNGNGTYTATFTGTLAGANTITATINGQAVTSPAPSISVTPGTASTAQSFVSVASGSVQSGNTDTLTLQAEDANGNDLVTGGLNVTFVLGTGAGTGTFSSVTDNGNGTYTASFTGVLVGVNTITATLNGQALTSPSPSITVIPGTASLANSVVQLSAGSVDVGTTTTVTLQAEDAAGNNETSGGLTVTFALGSSSGGQGDFSSVTDNGDGTYTATFTGTIPGDNTITATINGAGVTSSSQFNSITINPSPTITTSALPNWTVNQPYSQTIALAGGTAPETFAVSAGTLPPGLSLDSSTGAITGTPTTTSSDPFDFTVTATDAVGETASQAYSITINPELSIFTTLPDDIVDSPYNQTITVSGGTQPFTTFSVTAFDGGTTGLTSSAVSTNAAAGTFTISGTPIAPGTVSFTVTVTDSAGATLTQNETFTVEDVAPTASVSGPSAGVLYQPLTFSLGASDSVPSDQAGNFTYSIDWGDGTSTAPDVQTVVGTASTTATHVYTSAGTYTVTLAATDQFGTASTAATMQTTISATPQMQNGVLAIPGTASAATITLTPVLPTGASAYSMMVTLTVGTTTTNLGTYAVPSGDIEVYGGPGTNAVTLAGTTSQDAFTLGSGVVTEIAAESTLAATSFTVGLSAVTALSLEGSASGDSLTGPNQANTWTITGRNSGTLDGTTSFSGMADLTGGSAGDIFTFDTGGSITGNLSGSATTTTVDFSQAGSPVTVNLQTTKATGIGGTWSSIQSFIGTGTTDTLVATNANNTWTISGTNSGTVDGISFAGFPNLTGGTANDNFAFRVGGSIAGNLKGNGPVNILDYSGYGSPVTVNLQDKTAPGIGGTWASIQSFIGTGTTDTLVGDNVNRTWSITGANVGTVGAYSFSGFPNLTGGAGNNTFTFAAGGSVAGAVVGQAGTSINTLNYSSYGSPVTVDLQTATATGIGGTWTNVEKFRATNTTDTLIATDGTTNTWALKGTNAGTVDGVSFTGFANLTGGTGDDDFVFAAAARITSAIDGAGGTNTLDYSAYLGGVTVNLGNGTTDLANFSATGVNGGAADGVSNISAVIGGAGNNYLTAVGATTDIAFTVTSNGNNILVGGSGSNTLTAAGSGNNIIVGGDGTATISGGTGYDLLIGGTTDYDAVSADLKNILGIWKTVKSATLYTQAISRLTSPTSATSLTATTVHSNASDTITAGTQLLDWYFVASQSEITGEKSGETVTLC
jgi:adhesin/invasin